ncbi:MAG: SDR family oxidoreductase [Planctomycetales bacterium]|nr:SDR family oxidoreductase [Planctomycetales bacterium]
MSSKCILVIGGGTGIGKGIARSFAADGWNVAIAGRRESILTEAAADIQTEKPVLTHTVDVGDRENTAKLIDWAIEKLGRIDVLVNSAGINIKNRTMAAMTPEQFDQIMTINAVGPYNCMYSVLPHMRANGDGLIVNITSIAGKRATDLAGIAYCASKFGATGLGTAVGLEEAARGIRVTNVYPGEVETPLLDQRPNPVSAEHRARILQPEDIGDVILAIAKMPPRAHVPEIVIKPTLQQYA